MSERKPATPLELVDVSATHMRDAARAMWAAVVLGEDPAQFGVGTALGEASVDRRLRLASLFN